VRVRLGEHFVHFDMFNNPHLSLPQHGQQVTLSFPPEGCLILGDRPTSAES